MRTLSLALIAVAAGLTPTASIVAQSAGADAAFLFAYRAKPGMDAEFAQGYRRHLDWHAAHSDSLPWLAWTVIDGPSLGTFVDGTFGIAFKAFDDRVDPRGDAEDAGRNVSAFAVATDRQVLRLRRDLSPSTRLESGKAGTMQRVVWLSVKPGAEAPAEQTLRALAAKRGALDYAVYERISGGDQPGYIVVVQFNAWAAVASAETDPAHTIVRSLASSLSRVQTETWLYRPDLVYFPKR
jgi:hypothetical protein